MTSARDVPALAAAHAVCLGSPAMRRYIRQYIDSIYRREETIQHGGYLMALREANGMTLQELAYSQGDQILDAERNRMNITSLFHVTEPMIEVAKVAAAKLDENVEHWGLEALPRPTGFLVFEKTLSVVDVWNRQMQIKAVSWHWGRVLDISTGRDRLVTQFYFWVDSTDPEDAYNKERDIAVAKGTHDPAAGILELSHLQAHVDGSYIGPWGLSASERGYRADMLEKYGDDVTGQIPIGELDVLPHFAVETVNITRIMYALFALMDQTITDVSESIQDRHQHKMHLRKGNRPPGMVTVIKLRRTKDHGYYTGDGHWLTYRAVTDGHWRRQHYGPGRTEVKRIWINPYVRGPEDAPFRDQPKVSTLVR